MSLYFHAGRHQTGSGKKISKKSPHAIAVINDTNRPVNEEFIEALATKNADYILWSQKDRSENIRKLAA